MLSEILKALIITSLTGSLLTLVIVLIKPFTKKFLDIRGIIISGSLF